MSGWLKECLSGDATEVNPFARKGTLGLLGREPRPSALSDGRRRRCHPHPRRLSAWTLPESRPGGGACAALLGRVPRGWRGDGTGARTSDPGVGALPGA